VRIVHDGKEQLIPADTVILAVGSASHNPLYTVAAELKIAVEVVGDARQPATVLEATHQGFNTGRTII
jgi:2,4-dienoyl-CoA reductase (NADPH2)